MRTICKFTDSCDDTYGIVLAKDFFHMKSKSPGFQPAISPAYSNFYVLGRWHEKTVGKKLVCKVAELIAIFVIYIDAEKLLKDYMKRSNVSLHDLKFNSLLMVKNTP